MGYDIGLVCFKKNMNYIMLYYFILDHIIVLFDIIVYFCVLFKSMFY